MKDSSARQWAMVQYIPRYPRKIDANTLQRKLEHAGYEISLRSIQRDLNQLSLALPLIGDDAKPQGWSWQEGAEQLQLPLLEPQAAVTFHLVERHMRSLLPESTLAYLGPWFKTANALLDEQASGVTRWPEKVRVLPRGLRLQAPVIDPAVHTTVYQCVLQERQLRLRYRARQAPEAKEYVVHPVSVVVRDNLVYLLGTIGQYPDVRQLVLHRIAEATMIDEAAVRPAGFDLDTYIAQGGFGYAECGDEIDLVARFTEAAAAHLHECPLTAAQVIEADVPGFVRIKARLPDTQELKWWLLGFGDQVVVLSPPLLAEKMRTAANNMAGLYV